MTGSQDGKTWTVTPELAWFAQEYDDPTVYGATRTLMQAWVDEAGNKEWKETQR